ncbi:hypothetical protein ACLOJK_001451 [Asimina triloba]
MELIQKYVHHLQCSAGARSTHMVLHRHLPQSSHPRPAAHDPTTSTPAAAPALRFVPCSTARQAITPSANPSPATGDAHHVGHPIQRPHPSLVCQHHRLRQLHPRPSTVAPSKIQTTRWQHHPFGHLHTLSISTTPTPHLHRPSVQASTHPHPPATPHPRHAQAARAVCHLHHAVQIRPSCPNHLRQRDPMASNPLSPHPPQIRRSCRHPWLTDHPAPTTSIDDPMAMMPHDPPPPVADPRASTTSRPISSDPTPPSRSQIRDDVIDGENSSHHPSARSSPLTTSMAHQTLHPARPVLISSASSTSPHPLASSPASSVAGTMAHRDPSSRTTTPIHHRSRLPGSQSHNPSVELHMASIIRPPHGPLKPNNSKASSISRKQLDPMPDQAHHGPPPPK